MVFAFFRTSYTVYTQSSSFPLSINQRSRMIKDCADVLVQLWQHLLQARQASAEASPLVQTPTINSQMRIYQNFFLTALKGCAK